MNANVLVYAVLLLFSLILIGCTVLIVSWKLMRELHERRDRPMRHALSALATAVALDHAPPPAPARGRERRVARDVVMDATSALIGPSRRRAIRWFEDNGYVEDAVREFGRTVQRWRRAEIATTLGRMGSSDAAPALARGLLDRRYRVRDACATALGRVATSREVDALIGAVERRDVPRGILSGALLNLGPDSDSALIRCLRHPDSDARDLVARVLGMRRCAAATPALMEAIGDPVPEVRRNAVLALAEIASQTDIAVDPEPLIRLAMDDAPIVRAAAATGLGQILGDRAAGVLTSMTQDPEYWVSHRAAESLCRLPSGTAFGWRVLRSHPDTPGARRAQAACLEWLERTGGVEEYLDETLARDDDDALREALAVLERAGSRAWGDLVRRDELGVAS